jgi:hypothetical protein
LTIWTCMSLSSALVVDLATVRQEHRSKMHVS